MSDFHRVNKPRADKLVDMVRIINKSARSHGTDSETMRHLYQPVIEEMGLANTAKAEEAPKSIDKAAAEIYYALARVRAATKVMEDLAESIKAKNP